MESSTFSPSFRHWALCLLVPGPIFFFDFTEFKSQVIKEVLPYAPWDERYIYLHEWLFFYGTCRYIFHTWSIWVYHQDLPQHQVFKAYIPETERMSPKKGKGKGSSESEPTIIFQGDSLSFRGKSFFQGRNFISGPFFC